MPASNDRMVLDVTRKDDPTILARYFARHLLPVYDDDGNQICEGFPSIAQYLEGQPPDTRGYRYVAEWEPMIRRRYADMQPDYRGPSDHDRRDPRMRPGISELEAVLREALGDPGLVRKWLTQPHPDLGVTPMEAINAGHLDQVRGLAERISG